MKCVSIYALVTSAKTIPTQNSQLKQIKRDYKHGKSHIFL